MAVKEWTTIYPATGIDDAVTQMPNLDDDSVPGAGDGDQTRSSQVEAPRDAVIQLETLVGSDLLESGSIREVLTNDVLRNNQHLLFSADNTYDIGDVAAAGRPKDIFAAGTITAADFRLSEASGSDILWNTDGGGNIGAAGATRPGTVYAVTGFDAESAHAVGTDTGSSAVISLDVRNTTVAAAGAQQYSPVIRIGGEGWKTDATAESQEVDFYIQTRPVQGAAAPTGNLHFSVAIDEGSLDDRIHMTSAGDLLWSTDNQGAIGGNSTNRPSGVNVFGVVNCGSEGVILRPSQDLGTGLGTGNNVDTGLDAVFLFVHRNRTDAASNYVFASVYDRGAASITNADTMRIHSFGWTDDVDAYNELFSVRGDGDVFMEGDGDILWASDGGGDIGGSAANRPNTVYALTGMTTPGGFSAGGVISLRGLASPGVGLGTSYGIDHSFSGGTIFHIAHRGRTDGPGNIVIASVYDVNAASITNAATMRIHSFGWTDNVDTYSELAYVRADGVIWAAEGFNTEDAHNIGTSTGSSAVLGLDARNTTVAAAGAQQYSPVIRLGGEGWKTDATAESQEVDWYIQVRPVQAAAAPQNHLYFSSAINEGSLVDIIEMDQAANFLWATDATGQIGSIAGNRPGWINAALGLSVSNRIRILDQTYVGNLGLGGTGTDVVAQTNAAWPLALSSIRTDGSGNIVHASVYDRNAASITNADTMRIHSFGWTNNADAYNELFSIRGDGDVFMEGDGTILWASDGGGSIGATTSNRPGLVYVQTAVTVNQNLSVVSADRATGLGATDTLESRWATNELVLSHVGRTDGPGNIVIASVYDVNAASITNAATMRLHSFGWTDNTDTYNELAYVRADGVLFASEGFNAEDAHDIGTATGSSAVIGLDARNTTVAAAGAQQYSPVIRLGGEGWKTDATAESQEVDFYMQVRPIQGAAAPTGNLYFSSAIDEGSLTDHWYINSSSDLLCATDGSGDIGASAANRPGNVYVGGVANPMLEVLGSSAGLLSVGRASANQIQLTINSATGFDTLCPVLTTQNSTSRPLILYNDERVDAVDAVVIASVYDRNAASITNAATMRIHTFGWTDNSDTYGELAAVFANGDLMYNKGANAQSSALKSLTESVTIAAAAFTDTTIQIPADAIAYAASVRVTTAIPTATTFDVGISGATTLYATGVSVALNTTDPGTASSYPTPPAAATSIRITPDATPGAATGVVRVTIHYFEVDVPTS